jgi:hypothetical protein
MLHFNHLAFSTLVKAEGRLREFNFRRKQQDGIPVYEVDVSDERGNRHYFSLAQQDQQWSVNPKFLPSWIASVMPQLPAVIREQEEVLSLK